MSRNPKNTQDNINNIRDEERTVPLLEKDRTQAFAELDRLLESCKNHSSNSMSEDTEKEIWKLKKDSIMDVIKKNQDKNQNTINSENLNSPFNTWMQWRKDNAYWDMKCNDLWDKAKKRELVDDVLKENKSNLCNYTEFLDANKQTVISEFKQTNTKLLVKNKPLGSAGDISINELISKGLDVIDTPLVQMIRDNVDVTVVGGFISSMFMYKTIVNFYPMSLETYLVRELKK